MFLAYENEPLYNEKGTDAKVVVKFIQYLFISFDARHSVIRSGYSISEQSVSNPLIRGLWSLSIGNVGSRERLESAFNKKYLLIINLEPQLHGLLLQLIWYVGSREKFESTFFKITYE